MSNVKGLGGTLALSGQFAERKQVQHWQDVIEKLDMKYGWKQESRSTAEITLTVDSIMYDRCQVRFSLPLEKEKRFDDFYHDKHVIALDSDRRKLQEFEVVSESKRFTPVIPRVLWELNRDPHCLCTTHEQVVRILSSPKEKIGTFFLRPSFTKSVLYVYMKYRNFAELFTDLADPPFTIVMFAMREEPGQDQKATIQLRYEDIRLSHDKMLKLGDGNGSVSQVSIFSGIHHIENELLRGWRQKLDELRHHKRWYPGENLKQCMEQVVEDSKKDSNKLKYFITFDDKDYPWQGMCLLVWYMAGHASMTRATCEPVSITPTGFYLWEHPEGSVDALVSWFKRTGFKRRIAERGLFEAGKRERDRRSKIMAKEADISEPEQVSEIELILTEKYKEELNTRKSEQNEEGSLSAIERRARIRARKEFDIDQSFQEMKNKVEEALRSSRAAHGPDASTGSRQNPGSRFFSGTSKDQTTTTAMEGEWLVSPTSKDKMMGAVRKSKDPGGAGWKPYPPLPGKKEEPSGPADAYAARAAADRRRSFGEAPTWHGEGASDAPEAGWPPGKRRRTEGAAAPPEGQSESDLGRESDWDGGDWEGDFSDSASRHSSQ